MPISVTSYLMLTSRFNLLTVNVQSWIVLHLESSSIIETSLSHGSMSISDHYDSNVDDLKLIGRKTGSKYNLIC